jgi:endonuclease G
MEHKNYGYSGDSYATASMMKEHAMSIDNLEKLTGIDFFCNLPNALEDNVEASYSESAWSWK